MWTKDVFNVFNTSSFTDSLQFLVTLFLELNSFKNMKYFSESEAKNWRPSNTSGYTRGSKLSGCIWRSTCIRGGRPTVPEP